MGGREKEMPEENIKTEDTNKAEKVETKPLTFDELLKDKAYQSEFDKRVTKALETAKTKWEQEAVVQKNEAERLAKMTEEERHAEELKKVQKEKEEALAKLNAYELKGQAVKIANEKSIDVALVDLIDFTKETADSVKDKIDIIEKAFKKAVEDGVNNRLKQPAPTNHAVNLTTADQSYLDAKYKDNPYYKRKRGK